MNETVNIINHKKGVKPQNMSIKPKKQAFFIPGAAKHIVKLLLKGKQITIEKVGMEPLDNNLKEPFLLIGNHWQFTDFPIQLKSILPRKFISVAAIDGFRGVYGVLQGLGRSVPKRKFTKDLSLVRNMVYTLKTLKNVFCLYQEPQYNVDGINTVVASGIGKVIKMLKVPVVTLNMRGNFSNCPTFSDQKPRNEIPLFATQTYALTPDEIEKMSAEEIQAKIGELLNHNDWEYWQESGVKITYPNRAVGIEKIFYRCPECNAEFNMISYGANIKCKVCENEWTLTENGFLEGINHESKFNSPSDWVKWERAEVKKDLISGKYIYEDICEAFSIPNAKTLVKVGKVNLKHTEEGFTFNGHYNKQNFKFIFEPVENYCIQVELNCPNFFKKDIIALSTLTDTVAIEPTNVGACYKLMLAAEELYKLKTKK